MSYSLDKTIQRKVNSRTSLKALNCVIHIGNVDVEHLITYYRNFPNHVFSVCSKMALHRDMENVIFRLKIQLVVQSSDETWAEHDSGGSSTRDSIVRYDVKSNLRDRTNSQYISF